MFLPRVEALLASTLGYEIATPTELLLLAGHNSSLMMRPPGLCMISPLTMMCAPTTMYGYPIVDDAPPQGYAWLPGGWKTIARGCLYHPQGDGDNDKAHNIYMVCVLSSWGEPERGFL